MLCPPHARLSPGYAAPSAGSSGFSAGLVRLPGIHELPFDDSSDDADSKVDAHPPCPFQIGVCPQSRTTPDLGTPTLQLTAVGHTQDRAATRSAAVIPHHSLDAENAFLNREEDPAHSLWASCSEPSAPRHNTNATADLSASYGISATLGQHKTCPDRDDSKRTRSVTTPPVPPQHDLSPPFVPLEHAYVAYDASLTYISDDVVLFWHPPSAFSQWTRSPFTKDLVEYNCAEQFMMASKARLFGDDTALSAILASNDPREQKRLGRRVRHFDHELWQSHCKNIVLQGTLAKFSQNNEMRFALLQTGDRRLAEASPHDNLWGIGLSACDPRASSPDSWCGTNLLGQALENARELLRHESTAPPDDPAPETPVPRDDTGDTVFEVDPITHFRLDPTPPPANAQTAVLSAFTESVPDDHAPEVLLAQDHRTDAPPLPEQGPDLLGGIVTMDDARFTTLLTLHSGVSTTSRFDCRALLDTGSPQSFIHQGAFDQMAAMGAADPSCIRSTTPKTWSGFGSQQLLSTNRQARMTVQFHHNGTTSASLAVWMYIVPNETMRCPLLLGRDSWMRFPTRSYQTLPPQPDGRISGELTLSSCDDNFGSAAAYIRNCETLDAAYHLVYNGPGVTLTDSPQLIPVNLVRLDGSPALTGHYMVDFLPDYADSVPSERFVSSGRQLIPLTGCQDLEPDEVLGTASSPLLRVPLKTLTPSAHPADVSALAESSTPPTVQPPPPPNTSDPPDEPPPELLHRLDHSQRESFLRLWNTVPPHIRRIDFALDAAGWDSAALDALATTLVAYADVFSSSKLDYGECSTRPFEIKVPPETQPIQSRPYRLNPVLSKQVDAILDSYLAAGLIQHSTSPWSSPLVCVPKKSGGIRITVNYQKLNKVTEIPQIAIPRADEVLDTLGGGSVFSVFDLFSGFTQLTIHPDTIPLTAFCTPNGLYEWLRMPQGAAGAPAWFVSVMRLVTAGLDNIRMYLDDAIGSDDCPLHHVATLATFFARLRLHQLKLSPDKSRIGAARVDFLGHVISADGVRPNDDRVAALTRMPMPTDIKQLRSLLGGLSYYRKFLPNMAHHIRPVTALLKKGAAFEFTSAMETTVRTLLAELAAPPILVFPDWDAVIDTSRPFRLHCDASTAGLGATLEQEQPDGSIRPIVYISRATLDNEQNWTPMELEAGCVVWSIRRLRRYLFGVYFLVFTDHQCLQQICKIGETKPRIQRWMEFLSAYNFRLSYRRGQENANADFLSRLPLPPIADDISGASALTDPDDLGVYLIRACGLTTPSCPIPGVGLGGLAPSPDIPVLCGLAPSPDTPVLGGLPLTSDDFRTHRAPTPSPPATRRLCRPRAILPQVPYTTYAIDPRDDAPRPTRRTRSQTAILEGNTPSRPDYRTAAHSGFAASAAAAPPPLRTSPPPRSARLGSTTAQGRRTPSSSTPPPADLQSVPLPLPAPLLPTAPDPNVQATVAHLSNTLLNYSHSDWEHAQREDPLCDATRRYLQLGCPQHRLTSLCDHISSHRRPASTDILDLAAKGRLIQGDHGTTLLVRNPATVAPSPADTPARPGRSPFNDPVRIYVPLLARPWIMHACHADASCHLGVTRTLKMLERFFWWVGMEVCTKWWVRRCLKCQARKTSRQTVRWPVLPIPLPNSPGVAVSVDYFGPLPITARGNSYILLFTDRFSRRADIFAVTTAEFTAEGTANILVNRFIPLWGCPSTLLSDNGPQFCARLATAVYKLLGIHKLTTSAYHPSGNGGVERVNHTMAQMLAMVCNEHQNDWDVHLPHVEYAYHNSVSAATGLAPNEVHIGRLPRLPLTVFDRSYGGTHQNLDRDQLAYCDLARERQQRAYELVREQHALTVARVNGRNSALSDALLRRPQYAAGGWVWIYNTAATIRQGLRKGADTKILKEKLSLNWTGPFKILAVGPAPAADTPDGRPLGDKLLYLDLPSNLSGPAAKPRVTVARCKPCDNPYDADDIPRHLPAGLTQYVLHAFATKSPPYHVTTDDVSTPPILIDVAKITGHQCVRGRGGAIAVLYETHWNGILRPTWERELDLQAFRHLILAYWAKGPDHHQPNTRQYQQLRINAAARELARAKGERYLPGSYRLVTTDVYRARFLSAPLPIGASIWFHSFDGSWWLGKIKQPSDALGRYIVRFLDNPGPVLLDLPDSAYDTALHVPCGSWCLQTHGRTNPLQGVLHG